MQNYPNPFNPSTQINYRVPLKTHVRLSIYNTLGQKIKILVNGVQQAGAQSSEWDGTDSSGEVIAPGVYVCTLEIADVVSTTKMLMLH